MRTNFLRTPKTIDQTVTDFCLKINPDYSPRSVQVVPAKDSKNLDCFYNVQNQVKIHGGKIAYGWVIWVWPKVFIEAEHHAVWENDGKLVDITSRNDGEKTILFLPDPNRSYDFKCGKRIDNTRLPLSTSSKVIHLLEILSLRAQKLEESREDGVIIMDRNEYELIQKEVTIAFNEVINELATITR